MNKSFMTFSCLLAIVSLFLIAFPVNVENENKSTTRKNTDNAMPLTEETAISISAFGNETRLPALRVALLFNDATLRSSSEQTSSRTAPIEEALPQTATWLRKLGVIRDQNDITRLYFKDIRTGSLIRVRTDGTEESGYRLTSSKGISMIYTPEGPFVLPGE